MAHTSRLHWSYSQISQYLRCPLQYYFERIAKLPRGPVDASLVLGSSVHHALAEYHLGLQHGRKLSEAAVGNAFREEWTRRKSRETIEFGGKDELQLVEQGLELVGLWTGESEPDEIVAVEQPMLVPLYDRNGDVLERPLVAVIDLVIRVDGRLRLIEFKTSGRKYGESEVATSLQASCYVHAAEVAYGERPEVEFAVLVKTKTPKLQRVTTSRSDRDLIVLGETARMVEKAIDSELFYPVASPMNCSTCSYKVECSRWLENEESQPDLVPLKPSVTNAASSTNREAVLC